MDNEFVGQVDRHTKVVLDDAVVPSEPTITGDKNRFLANTAVGNVSSIGKIVGTKLARLSGE